MKIGIPFMIRNLFLLAAVLFITACVPSINLKSNELPQSKNLNAMVVVGEIKDLRDKSEGGGDFSKFGKLRGGFGNPVSIKAAKGKELDTSLRAAVGAALMNTGYRNVSATEKNAPLRLETQVLSFWCDGYVGYKVNAVVLVRLVNNKTGALVAEKKITASRGFALVMGYGPMHSAFNDVLNQVVSELVDFLKTDKVRTAARSS